ncbi:hypothetical protein Hte_002670 [Hypoxylon texense]
MRRAALYVPLTGALASPLAPRQSDCAALSTTAPNWKLSNAISSDWPGSGAGRVQLFSLHVPTGELSSCVVNYSMDAASGQIVDYDPTAAHACTNFGAGAANTTVTLDMDTLLLGIRSTWACAGDAATAYAAAGSTSLDRDTSPGACLVEPNQTGNATTCPISDVEVKGTLVA